ncbi:MAG: hypothetical protein EHM93_04300 [Bacteroidales bacterium]|nr:MAG: hypothetical protein EHM93_04300 [Bacteroidales bacterium]
MRQFTKRIAKYLLLILFVGYWGSITLFPHSHIVNNFNVIHSHPYKTDQNGKPYSHKHTSEQFLLIDLLSYFVTGIIAFALVLEVFRSVQQTINVKAALLYIDFKYLSNLFLRAPPLRFNH